MTQKEDFCDDYIDFCRTGCILTSPAGGEIQTASANMSAECGLLSVVKTG